MGWGNTFSEALDKATDSAKAAARKAADTALSNAQQAREIAGRIIDYADQFEQQVEDHARQTALMTQQTASGAYDIVKQAYDKIADQFGSKPVGSPMAPCAANRNIGPPATTGTGPCSGRGMSNDAAISPYATEMAALREQWPKMTSDARKTALQDIVNNVARKENFPAPTIQVDSSLDQGRNGELRFQTWSIAINPALTNKPVLTDGELAALSDTIYHETRHAEQWWLIARRDAADGLTMPQIVRQRGIHFPVVQAALKVPLDKKSPLRPCADAMYDSVYGKNGASRNATLKALSVDRAAIDAAAAKCAASQKAYDALAKNPAAKPADKAAALRQWQQDYTAWKVATAKFNANYSAYRALPEEADAWDSGSRAGKATADRLKKPTGGGIKMGGLP